MATPYTPTIQGTGAKATIQKMGGYLAGMVMPNIAAIIAWGLITALFIPTGWTPVAKISDLLVGPMINILLPVLIGYTGGKLVHGTRGAVVGAVATFGVVAGAGIPMFLGGMIAGPLTAYILKMFDRLIEDRIKPGFEMIVDNFSAGIIGGGMAIGGLYGIEPVVKHLSEWAGGRVDFLVSHHLLPFASVLVEPAKVLFLNNAINHGVLAPLGVQQAAQHGKSIMFMIESNPGPGLGILVAYWMFGPRALRASAPAAIIIQFLGGIHEIYFPYVLMKPRLILAAIAGGMSGILVFQATGAGLVATPAPGSIFAYIAESPKGGLLGVLAGVVVAAGVSFVVSSLLLGFGRLEKPEEDVLAEHEAAKAKSVANKNKPSSVPGQAEPSAAPVATRNTPLEA
jgi:mannitol PTS system EIICBA or EIICB component